MSVPEFDPSIRGGFSADGSKHKRIIRSIADHFRARHIGSGQLATGAVDQAALGAGAVTDAAVADVSASKITAGSFGAQMLMAGGQLASAEAGSRYVIDASGIFLEDANGNIMVGLPTGGDTPFVKAFVEALGLIISGNLSLAGVDNLIETGAVITMGGATAGVVVANPTSKPGLQQVWETLTFAGTHIDKKRGLYYDSTNTSFWTTENNEVREYNDDGAFIRSKQVANFTLGAVRSGSFVYVLGASGTPPRRKLYKLNESDLSFVSEADVEAVGGITINGLPGLGFDGTNLVVVDFDAAGSGAKLRFHKFDSSLAFVSSTTSSGTGNPTFDAGLANAYGFAVNTDWYVAAGGFNGAGGKVYRFSTAGVYVADNEFPSFGGAGPLGVAWDATQFWTAMSDTRICKHTGWTWTTESPKYWVAYTWVDDNGAASAGSRPLGSGDFETKKSPSASITLHRRGRLRITTPTRPATATHAGIYIDRATNEPTLDYITDITTTSTERTSFTAGGAAPPASNNFGTGTNSEFRTSDGAPLVRANGMSRCIVSYGAAGSVANNADRYVRFGTEEADTDAYHPSTTDALASAPDTTYDITLPFAGQYLVVMSYNFAANATGDRHMFVELNGTGFRRFTDVSVNTNAHRSGGTEVVPAAAGDTLRFGVFQDSGAGLALNNARASVIFLGPAT